MNLIEEEFNRYSDYINYNQLRNKTFLITGARGYLASTTIKFLLYLNKKYALNLYIYATTRNISNIPDYIKDTDPIKYICFEAFDLQNYDRKIDYLIHTANPTSRLAFINDPLGTFDIINDGTRKVLEFAKKQDIVSILYLSSVEVYGSPKTDKLVEEKDYFALDPNDIRNCYPLGKLNCL